MQYSHDHSTQIRINRLIAICRVCNWEGKFGEYQQHIHGDDCDLKSRVYPFQSQASPPHSPTVLETLAMCNFCKVMVPRHEIDSHLKRCPLRGKPCPFKDLGCPEEGCFVVTSDLEQHMRENEDEHFTIMTKAIQRSTNMEMLISAVQRALQVQWRPQYRAILYTTIDQQLRELVNKVTNAFKDKLLATMRENLKFKDEEIADLQKRITKLEKSIRLQNAKIEDQDFRLSIIKNGNHDGSMVWKIPQFSRRKADAENSKHTSIFSPPFYSGRYGYKMCLHLYIMGDGVGKGTHLSLFFVVMRGEFDNILQWPFTHKVTFKLINQAGDRDIVDTFQPDPMSSFFGKPKSDMNVASGCPRFVSHAELERGGFIVDDTIFIKCIIDTSTIRHP